MNPSIWRSDWASTRSERIKWCVARPRCRMARGKKVRVLVFAKGEKEQEARQAGADYVGSDDLMEKIKGGWMEFDCAISTPDLMAAVGKLGKVLGPRGLMPNPKTGTVTFEVGKAVSEIRKGRVEYKVEKAGIVQVPVGKVSFKPEQLYDNAAAVLESVIKRKACLVQGTLSEERNHLEHDGARREARCHRVSQGMELVGLLPRGRGRVRL